MWEKKIAKVAIFLATFKQAGIKCCRENKRKQYSGVWHFYRTLCVWINIVVSYHIFLTHFFRIYIAFVNERLLVGPNKKLGNLWNNWEKLWIRQKLKVAGMNIQRWQLKYRLACSNHPPPGKVQVGSSGQNGLFNIFIDYTKYIKSWSIKKYIYLSCT